MGDEGSIIKALRSIAGKNDGEHIDIVVCTVDSVDSNAFTCVCTPISGDSGSLIGGENSVAQLLNVQLTAQKASNGAIPVPAVNSEVLVLTTVRLDSYVILCADIQEWVIFIDNGSGGFTQIIVNSSGIQLNDGSYGGLVEVIPLVSAIATLQNQLNSLKTLFNAHVHTGVTTGLASSGPPATPDTDPAITPTTRNDVENTKITHGV